jgi:hypothetical protein
MRYSFVSPMSKIRTRSVAARCTDVEAEDFLRARNTGAVLAARVKIEFFLGLPERKRNERETKKDGKPNAFNFHL